MRMPVTAVFLVILGSPGFASAQTSSDPPRQMIAIIRAAPGVGAEVAGTETPQMPARDQRPKPRIGTAVIRGRVVDGTTGRPLVHARVRIGGGMGPSPSALTDTSGSFSFTNLPSGRYSLMATKPAYLMSSFPETHGSLRNIPGFLLSDRQMLDNVTIPLYRGGVILGYLVDAYGDPVEGVSVQVVRAPGSRTSGAFSMSGSVNDAGEFRIGRLQPGSYLLFAMPNGSRSEGDPDTTANVPTYYPGVLSPDQAQPIVVERGQTLSGIDFQILEQQVTIVRGLVLDATGQPAQGGSVSAQMHYTIGSSVGFFSRGNSTVQQDGTFELKLPPGEYDLSAYARPRDEVMMPAAQAVGARSSMNAPQQTGYAPVTVSGEPITNVVIRAGAGGTITGKIVVDGDGPPIDPKQVLVSVHAHRVAGQQGPIFGPASECRSGKPATVNSDLTFTIEDVHGTCALGLNLMANAGRWQAKSAIYRGADLLDRPVEIGVDQHVRDVTITLSDRRTELAADVTDDQGAASSDYVLLAFSTDRPRWLLSRYIAYMTRSASSQPVPPTPAPGPGAGPPGASASATMSMSFAFGATPMTTDTITTLPAGDYYVVAIDDASYEDIHDPAYLEQLVGHATRVTLREGEPQKVTLRQFKPSSPAQ
jgi:hypothetical protein